MHNSFRKCSLSSRVSSSSSYVSSFSVGRDDCVEDTDARPRVYGTVVNSESSKPRLESIVRQTNIFQAKGLHWGLANALANENADICKRVFLLDNSGSTASADGHTLMQTETGLQYVSATRWQEISAMAREQADWNALVGVRCEFILLNPPVPEDPQEGRDYVIVDPASQFVLNQIAALDHMLNRNGPRGPTPLSLRLRELRYRLSRQEQTGGRIMLTIVTDGVPSSPTNGNQSGRKEREDFVCELRAFACKLNAYIVIRLATDDKPIVEYYNRIDEELEFPLDIIDDLRGEAQELKNVGNGWIAYTPILHRIREGGSEMKVLDLLDERALVPHEIATFLDLLLRRSDDPPFPQDPAKLVVAAKAALADEDLVFDGLSGSMRPVVDIRLLEEALGLTLSAKLSRWKSRLSSLIL